MFRTLARFVPPPAGLKPPSLWGTEARLRELFGRGVSAIQATRRNTKIRHTSTERWLEFNRRYLGPNQKAFEALDALGQEALARALTDLMRRANRSGDSTLVAPSDYLEVVAVRA